MDSHEKKHTWTPQRNNLNPLIVTTSVALFLGLLTLWHYSRNPGNHTPESNQTAWQHYDVPPSWFDPQLNLLSPYERFLIPTAIRLDFPMGAENGALTYNAQAYWSLNTKRGGRHTGDDYNGIGGQNTDYRDPVYAPGDGLVLYAGEPGPGWGKTLILAHRLQNGRLLQSMFAHLDEILVLPGKRVARGSKIGLVGTANGNYLAHLHLEIREGQGIDIGPGYLTFLTNRRNPTDIIKTNRPHIPEALSKAPLQMLASPDVVSGF